MVEVGRKAAEPNEVGMEKYGMPTVMARTNDHCLYKVEYGVVNTVQFKKKEGQLICSLCQKQPSYIPCKARRYLVIKESHVRVFHYGNHTCAVKRPPHSSGKGGYERISSEESNRKTFPCAIGLHPIDGKQVSTTLCFDDSENVTLIWEIQWSFWKSLERHHISVQSNRLVHWHDQIQS